MPGALQNSPDLEDRRVVLASWRPTKAGLFTRDDAGRRCKTLSKTAALERRRFFRAAVRGLLLRVSEVEAIEVHDLDPRVHEVIHEALLSIGFGVNFRDCA
jgi:hypothetical protein